MRLSDFLVMTGDLENAIIAAMKLGLEGEAIAAIDYLIEKYPDLAEIARGNAPVT